MKTKSRRRQSKQPIETYQNLVDSHEWKAMITLLLPKKMRKSCDDKKLSKRIFEALRYRFRTAELPTGFLQKREFGEKEKGLHYHISLTDTLDEDIVAKLKDSFLKIVGKRNNQGGWFLYEEPNPGNQNDWPAFYMRKTHKGGHDVLSAPKGFDTALLSPSFFHHHGLRQRSRTKGPGLDGNGVCPTPHAVSPDHPESPSPAAQLSGQSLSGNSYNWSREYQENGQPRVSPQIAIDAISLEPINSRANASLPFTQIVSPIPVAGKSVFTNAPRADSHVLGISDESEFTRFRQNKKCETCESMGRETLLETSYDYCGVCGDWPNGKDCPEFNCSSFSDGKQGASTPNLRICETCDYNDLDTMVEAECKRCEVCGNDPDVCCPY